MRLTTSNKNPPKVESRIPSIAASRLRPPGQLKTTSITTLPHFGIARGVQQVQPQPSIAYGVTVAPPMRRDVKLRPATSLLNAAKSRSQENLNVPPKPRAARPVSTCLGSNDLLAASKQSPFIRNRQRASIGGTAPFSSPKHVAPPIATLPPARSSESSVTKWGFGRATTAKTTGSVKLSDMKNALPITPVPARKLTTTTELQFSRRRPTSIEPSRASASVDETAAVQMMESLELSTTTRLRKPQAAKLVSQSIETKATTSSSTSNLANPESSPIQRRTAWRRSLHFTTATSSPPPPPPRKNFATLPKNIQSSGGNNNNLNNNNNNNNNLHHNPSSKLPVPAFKRNSHLGSNF